MAIWIKLNSSDVFQNVNVRHAYWVPLDPVTEVLHAVELTLFLWHMLLSLHKMAWYKTFQTSYFQTIDFQVHGLKSLLTSQVRKLFERIIGDYLVEFLEENKLLRDSQHGFRTRRSCLTNLLEFLDLVSDYVDEGVPVDAVYLDFQKARRHTANCSLKWQDMESMMEWWNG